MSIDDYFYSHLRREVCTGKQKPIILHANMLLICVSEAYLIQSYYKGSVNLIKTFANSLFNIRLCENLF